VSSFLRLLSMVVSPSGEPIINTIPDDAIVRPFGHRLGERPRLFIDEGAQVGGEHH